MSGELVIPPGTVLSAFGGSWRLGKRLGGGRFGSVFECAPAGGGGAAAGSASGGGGGASFPLAIKVAKLIDEKGAPAAKRAGKPIPRTQEAGLLNQGEWGARAREGEGGGGSGRVRVGPQC